VLAPPGTTADAAAAALRATLDSAAPARDATCHDDVAPADAPLPRTEGDGGRLRGPGAGRPPPTILVDARPGGTVTLQEVSWLDAAMGRARDKVAEGRGGE
jgi:hypothetical protein